MHLLAIVALAVLVPAATAGAAARPDGFVAAQTTGGVTAGTSQPQPTGGTHEGAVAPDPPRKSRKRAGKKRAVAPVLAKFSLGATALFDEGRPLPVRFRVRGRGRQVHVWVVAQRRGGGRVGSVDLGLRPTGKTLEIDIGEDRLGLAREGDYQIRLAVRDRRGRRAARAAGVATWLNVSFALHRFPVAGSFSWGGPGSRFGAARSGHTHQGQDLAANDGTPLVAPHAGVVSWISYQAEGAGHYLVIDSANEDRDYVFMHLQAGSIVVSKGQRVATGKLIARVGNSGSSSGAHLHFEVWSGGHWQEGGHPVDPLPLLQAWFKSAPGGARTLSEQTAGPTSTP